MPHLVHQHELTELMKAMAVDVREFIARELAPLVAKQAELQERLDALERAQHEGKGGSS